MKSKLLVPAFMAMSVVLFACDRVGSHPEDEGNGAAAANDPAKDVEAVKKVDAEMLAALKAKDAAKLGSYYADDAVAAMPFRGQVSGKAEIVKLMEADFKDPAFKLDFTPEKAEASGDLAYTRGRYTVAFTDSQTKKLSNGSGTYLTVFKRQGDGGWKVVTDIVHVGGGEHG